MTPSVKTKFSVARRQLGLIPFTARSRALSGPQCVGACVFDICLRRGGVTILEIECESAAKEAMQARIAQLIRKTSGAYKNTKGL